MKSTIERIDSYEFDERFYQKIVDGQKVFLPSVTYILGAAYPSGPQLTEWVGDVGNKRAAEILEETSAEGSYVHDAIHKMITKGEKISSEDISSRFKPKSSLKIKRCLKAFQDWYVEYKPKVIDSEGVVWSDQYGFAGTVDFVCEINGEVWLIDFKTSKSIHETHKVQVSGYGLEVKVDKVAILHLGNTTKKKYSFLEIEDRAKYERQFTKTLNLFKELNPNAKPTDEQFPEYFSL